MYAVHLGSSPHSPAGDGLTELEKLILGIERQRYPNGGVKVAAIRRLLGLSEIQYFQAPNTMLDRAAVIAQEPVLARYLRSVRDRRQR